jgi:hypothetical protein
MVFPCCDSPDSHATCGAWLAVISPHVPDSQHSGLRILSAANAQVKVQRHTVLQRDRPGCSLDCLLIAANTRSVLPVTFLRTSWCKCRHSIACLKVINYAVLICGTLPVSGFVLVLRLPFAKRRAQVEVIHYVRAC